MPTLPPVSERHWERVVRDFDDVGPQACVAEIVEDLRKENPHYLAIARRCASDAADEARAFTGFAKFYRILALDARERNTSVPRITAQTLDVVDALLEELGEERFIVLATETLCGENPSLSQMADSFASPGHDYLTVMQGFVLLYNCLSTQAVIDGLTAGFRSSAG